MTSFSFTVLKLTQSCIFAQDLKKYDAHVVVRVCEPTYNVDLLEEQGINVLVRLNWFVLVSFYGSI